MYKTLDEYISYISDKYIKLHLGCGSKYWKGWCNIDGYQKSASDTHRGEMKNEPDLWLDIRKLEVKNNSIDVICSQHVMEHFYRYEVIKMFRNFYKKLKPGGIVITEMPDLNKIIKLIFWLPIRPKYGLDNLRNRDMITSQFYGAAWEENEKGYPYHKYIWEKKEFVNALKDIGFIIILTTGATKSHVPFRDMAVICQKPINNNDQSLSSLSRDFKKSYGSLFFRIFIQIKTILRLLKIAFFQIINIDIR